MRATLTTIALCGLVASFSANAASKITATTPLQVLRNTPKVSSHVDPSCANFSGSWTGSCTGAGGQSITDTLTIVQQDCNVLSFGDSTGSEIIPVGGTTSVAGTIAMPAPGQTYGETISSSWNTGETMLRGS